MTQEHYLAQAIHDVTCHIESKITREEYMLFRKQVDQKGSEQLERLTTLLGSGIERFSRRAGLRNETVVRILGFGYLKASYFLSGITDKDKETFHHLGAVANLIVSLYDHIIDQFSMRRNPLTPKMFLNALNGRSLFLRFTYSRTQRVFYDIVRYYLSTLRTICVDRNQQSIYETITLLIFRMYSAERACAVGRSNVTDHARKSALPIVMTGITGWLCMPSPLDRWKHLLRMYRIGIFLGQVDDLVDFEEDKKSGDVNQFINDPAPNPRLGFSLINALENFEQQRRSPCTDHLQHLLSICTLSWMGGYRG